MKLNTTELMRCICGSLRFQIPTNAPYDYVCQQCSIYYAMKGQEVYEACGITKDIELESEITAAYGTHQYDAKTFSILDHICKSPQNQTPPKSGTDIEIDAIVPTSKSLSNKRKP